MKVADEPVMSDVVRRRLELLLGEVQPRHALNDDGPIGSSLSSSGNGPDRLVVSRAERSEAGTGGPDGEPSAGGADLAESLKEAGRRVLAFGKEHLAAVVLVLLVGCGWTVFSMLQARSTPVAVAAPPTVVASPTPTSPPEVVVHVLGAVRRPGVVAIPDGSRVGDAIEAAGGLTGAADPAELNLAAVVPDGAQILIGTRSRPRGEMLSPGATSATGGPAGSSPLSLNSATVEQLDTLPGVGPVTAQKILDWRTDHGRFSAVSELQEVDGIGPKTYADIAPHVRV